MSFRMKSRQAKKERRSRLRDKQGGESKFYLNWLGHLIDLINADSTARDRISESGQQLSILVLSY